MARTRRRIVAAADARLGTSTWPAHGAAGITAAYGLLKAYWVFGGTALWSIAPLSQEMIDRARSHTAPTWFEVADAASVALAAGGVFVALATVRPRRWLPARLVAWTLWPLAILMVLRALLSMPGDVQQLATGGSGELSHTALWDLVLWSPAFLIWGLLWAATALTYGSRVRTPARGTASGEGLSPVPQRGHARSGTASRPAALHRARPGTDRSPR